MKTTRTPTPLRYLSKNRGGGKIWLVMAIAALSFSTARAAEWLGIGGDTLWGTDANWESQTGVPVGNIAVSAKAGDHRTITLDGDHAFSGTFVVTAGTESSPVVFDATAAAVAAANHVEQTSTHGFDVKSGGVLKVVSGIYDWANDYRVSDASVLWMTGGRLTTKYWGVLSGSARVKMDGGELVSGWRDGAETDNGRLNLRDNSSIVMTDGRIRCANNTNGGNDAEALTIGENAGTTSVSVSGGEIVASGKIHLGMNASSVSELSVSGTGVVSSANDMRLGYNGADSTLTIADNGQVNVGTTAVPRWLILDKGRSTINLDGGTLSVGKLSVASDSTADIYFNGGTLKAQYSIADYIDKRESLTLNVQAGGAVIETDYALSIAAPFVSGESADGGLTKKGDGILTLTGACTYTGDTVVEQGVLALPYNTTLNGNLVIKEKGALVFDLTGCENLAANEEITLLTLAEGKALSFAAADDALETAVFLIGPVVDATLAYDADARTLTATLTDVTNASSTRKVTTWNGGAAGTASPADWHVDSNAHWSNGQPTGRDDIAVVPGDGKIFYWNGNGLAFGTYVIRHGTLFLVASAGNPTVKVKRVAGVGTLKSSHVGLEPSACNLTVDPTVAFEPSNEATTSDTWVMAASGWSVTVNGDIMATNGLFICYENAVLNGDVRVTYPGVTHRIAANAGGTTLNGTLQIGGGTTVELGSSLTLGAEAGLVYVGPAALTGTACTWPTVTVAGGTVDYTALPETAAESYAVRGGAVTIAAGAELSKPLAVSGGGVVVDVSGLADLQAGTEVTITGVQLADGLSAADVFTMSDGVLDWTFAVDEDGTIVATAHDQAQLIWNGGSADWLAADVWLKDGERAATFADANDVTFNGADMTAAETATNTVRIASTVRPTQVRASAPAGKGYRLTGAAVEAVALTQTGEGALICANDALTVSGTATVTAGALVLEGAALTAGAVAVEGGELRLEGATLAAERVTNGGTLRVAGAATSTLPVAPSGSGTIAIDEGATLAYAPGWIDQNVSGAGTFKPTAGAFTIYDGARFASFDGQVRIETGTTLNLQGGPNTGENYILGYNTKLVMAGGTVGRFGGPKGSFTNDAWLHGDLVFEDGTESALYNTESRSQWGGCQLRVDSAISGGGTATFRATTPNGWWTTLRGDNSGFTGVMNLSGNAFIFTTAAAGSADATWKFITADTLQLTHAAGTAIKFGALNVTAGGGRINVANEGAAVEVGQKGDSTIEGAFTGAAFTLTKKGAATALTLNGDSPNADVVVEAGAVGGTGTVKSLVLREGVEVDFGTALEDTTMPHDGLKTLTPPTWVGTGVVRTGVRESGKWVLRYRTETVTPEEGDAYNVYTVYTEFMKTGFKISIR